MNKSELFNLGSLIVRILACNDIFLKFSPKPQDLRKLEHRDFFKQ